MHIMKLDTIIATFNSGSIETYYKCTQCLSSIINLDWFAGIYTIQCIVYTVYIHCLRDICYQHTAKEILEYILYKVYTLYTVYIRYCRRYVYHSIEAYTIYSIYLDHCIQYTVYSIQYTVYIILYTVHYTMYSRYLAHITVSQYPVYRNII